MTDGIYKGRIIQKRTIRGIATSSGNEDSSSPELLSSLDIFPNVKLCTKQIKDIYKEFLCYFSTTNILFKILILFISEARERREKNSDTRRRKEK
jgi:hypothetical protein